MAAAWRDLMKARLALMFIAGILVWALPRPESVDPRAWRLLAIFVATLTGIIAKPLPMGAIALTGIAATLLTRTAIHFEDRIRNGSREGPPDDGVPCSGCLPGHGNHERDVHHVDGSQSACGPACRGAKRRHYLDRLGCCCSCSGSREPDCHSAGGLRGVSSRHRPNARCAGVGESFFSEPRAHDSRREIDGRNINRHDCSLDSSLTFAVEGCLAA